MPFRGLTMLKSRKLVIKGGLCYRFAMVIFYFILYLHNLKRDEYGMYDYISQPCTMNSYTDLHNNI